jgi:hypothetical protein
VAADDLIDPRMKDDDPPRDAPPDAPGGPYFGRLLVVLLLAVAFCGFMTWLLSTTMTN